jgi:hypothetical protein
MEPDKQEKAPALPNSAELLDTRGWLEEGAAEGLFGALIEMKVESPALFGLDLPDGSIRYRMIHLPGGRQLRTGAAPPKGASAALAFASRLRDRLSARTEGREPFEIESVQVRFSDGTPPIHRDAGFHRDQGGYLRCLTAAIGPGPLYLDEAGRERQVPAGSTLVLTTLNRETASGGRVPATWHSAPDCRDRRLLIVVDLIPSRRP